MPMFIEFLQRYRWVGEPERPAKHSAGNEGAASPRPYRPSGAAELDLDPLPELERRRFVERHLHDQHARVLRPPGVLRLQTPRGDRIRNLFHAALPASPVEALGPHHDKGAE